MWNPPLLDEALGLRGSPLAEAAELVVELVRRDARTICFIKSRKAVELIARFAVERAPELEGRIAPYRAGYTPQQRRELERRLVAGELRAVVATDALELGIDIGALDAAVIVTFPGTVASLKQMWGRAGRRGRGLAVYVAGEDALDQFLCRHPEALLERPVEAAILDHESDEIMRAHVACAAHEGPLTAGDDEFLGPRWREHAEALVAEGVLRERRGAFGLRHPEDYPAARVGLRSASPDSVSLVDTESGELVGTMETSRAPSTVHDGAVYLHMGRSFEVRALDLEGRRALLEPFTGDWFTQVKKETETGIEQLLDRRETLGVTLSYGRVVVSEQVIGFQRKRLQDHAVIDFRVLDMAPTSFATRALWFELDELGAVSRLPLGLLLGALHAAEHAQIAVLPLLAMCDRWDIGGLSTNAHPQTLTPTIFIYDGHPGGVGITRQGFTRFEELCRDAERLIAECPCRDGCPSCVQSPKCGNLNEPLAKRGALEVLRAMLSVG
jgi:DEAD/DEAH box helicase domain-containing protein